MNLDLTFRFIGLIAQISIPIAIFLAGRRIARAQFAKSVNDSWNEYHRLVLANTDNMRVARKKRESLPLPLSDLTSILDREPAIIRTERGLTISGTRITLYDLMDYL